MRIKKCLLYVAVLAMLVSMSEPIWAGGIISLNFSENSGNQIFAGNTLIGPLKTNSSHWNITDVRDSGSLAAGTKSGLKTDAGIVTTASVTWKCSNVWYNRDGTTGDENKMAVGYLDDGQTDATAGVGVDVTFTNLPYSNYRVYGLFASDTFQNTSPYTVQARNALVNGMWVFGGDSTTTATAYGSIGRNNDANGEYWTKIEPGVKIGNYWVIEASGPILTVRVMAKSGDSRGSLSAVIIEEYPAYLAANPNPANKAEVFLNQVLSWEQNPEVSGLGLYYDVYFGTEPNLLTMPLVKTTTTAAADFNYDPELAYETTYYWRVDTIEPNTPNPVIHTGLFWTFDTVPPAPVITSQPADWLGQAGQTAVLSITATNPYTLDTTGLSYQWYKDTVLMTNETDTTLNLTDMQIAKEGSYTCVVTVISSGATTTSRQAKVMTERLVGWWKLDGDLSDSNPGLVKNNGTMTTGTASYELGKDGNALRFGAVSGVKDIVTMVGSADYFNFYPNGYSVSAWIKTTQVSPWGAYIAKQAKSPDRGFILTHNESGQAVHTLRQSFNDLPTNVMIANDVWHLVTGTYDATLKEGKIYVDGLLREQTVNTGVPEISPADLIFGAELPDGSVNYIGLLDDVRIWNYPIDEYVAATLWTDFNPGTTICVEDYPMDISGPAGTPDCIVDLYDFAAIAEEWLVCNRMPESSCP